MSGLHIAIVAAYWHYPEVAYEFPLRLVKEGHKVTAILWNQDAFVETRHDVANGFALYKVPGINPLAAINSFYRYPLVLGLAKRISKLRPEIIDCQSHLFLTTFQAVEAAKKLGIPRVVTVHGVMARRNRLANLVQYVYLNTLGSRIFKGANIVRCLTKSDAKEVLRYGCSREKVRIIPNAVDTEFFRPKNTGKVENLIVWVGRFVKEKGLENLIEAAKIVASYREDAEFLLIGSGPLRQEIAHFVDRNGLSKNVILPGDFTRTQIVKTLQKATLFVLPSLKEGMAFALLEAMACGKAVIGSDISGINEVITHGQNGFLVQPGSARALADAILTLLDDENLRRKVGRNARQLMVEKYDWRRIISKTEKLYNETIEAQEKYV